MTDPDIIEGFLQEGLIMKDFHHDHVLSLIGVAMDDDGAPMIVLPFMGNGCLKDYIKKPQLEVCSYSLI